MTAKAGHAVNRVTARKIIEDILNDHGHLPQDVLNKIEDEQTREQVIAALFRKDQKLGKSLITLAKNLYTSNARFVFELLQNADDNLYTRAKNSGRIPCLSFHVFPDRIIVECNEDGFTVENVTAICQLGESSKKGAGAYIGEKGIGFKSVFMAAEKVYIQSGNFSFYFQHCKGDSGMGMISPVWQEPEKDLDGPMTRMTLCLHKDSNSTHELIRQQFRDLQDNLLLFLKNLLEIKISFFDGGGSCTSTTIYSAQKFNSLNRTCLTKKIITGSHTEESKSYFHLTEHIASNLAANENREYSDSEKKSAEYATAKVVLGFPLTQKDVPIEQTQEVFAFLPTGPQGFNFIINTDFVTIANRQGIVTTSQRNRDLRPHIASAFVKAILQFCEHPTLQYTWMRYLPQVAKIGDPFWQELVSQIKIKLLITPVLRTQLSGKLGTIQALKRNSPIECDFDWQPLFMDILEEEKYISSKYLRKDLLRLTEYDLKNMTMGLILKRVEADLRSSKSRMKSLESSDDWHSRAATLLLLPFDKKWNDDIRAIKRLELLPISSGTWRSPAAATGISPFYFPETSGMIIPNGLFDNIIDPVATKNGSRRSLFEKLGVEVATIKDVCNQITKKHRLPPMGLFGGSPFTINEVREHLQFLYLNHSEEQQQSSYRDIGIIVEGGFFKHPQQDAVYSPAPVPFGPRELLKPMPAGSTPGSGAPGLARLFIDERFLQDLPSQPLDRSDNFVDWLCTFVGIRRHIWLFDRGSLTEYCTYIAKYRPEKFLGLLKYNWGDEGEEVLEDPSLKLKLQGLKVLCNGDRMLELPQTYLPLPELKAICARFLEEGEEFPFLNLQQEITKADFGEWEFLTTLGVRDCVDVNLYLAILSEIATKNRTMGALKEIDRVLKLYETLNVKYLESKANNDDDQINEIRNIFKKKDLILLPADDKGKPCWVQLQNCRWDAPRCMITRTPLKSLYETHSLAAEKVAILQPFFKEALGVVDCKWDDFVDELRELSLSGYNDLGRITEIYNRLARIMKYSSSKNKVKYKQAFEDSGLIFAVTNGQWSWYKASQCLWLSATQIRGRVILNELYANLEDFFLQLGVPTLDLSMVYSELKEMGVSNYATISEVVNAIWTFNSFLQNESNPPDPGPILDGRLFPVRYPDGQTKLSSARIDFAIVDRKPLADAFREHVKLLDFTLHDIQRLKPFLLWAGLESRYLSTSVREVSALDGNIKEPISSAVRDIRKKAHALFRIASHFGNRQLPNDNSLYDLLKNAEVFETDGISSELHLSQEQEAGQMQLYKVQVARSELHIDETEEGLKVYVPRDQASQDVCYYSKLPIALTSWMMMSRATQRDSKVDEAAVRIVNSVLNARKSALLRILESEGIADTEFVTDENDEDLESITAEEQSSTGSNDRTLRENENEESQSDGEADERSHTPRSPSVASRETSLPTNGSIDTDDISTVSATTEFRATASLHGRVDRMASPGALLDLNVETNQVIADPLTSMGSEYLRILETTVTVARSFTFPSRGPFNMSGLLNALPTELLNHVNSTNEYVRFRSSSQIERDIRIGAAGELFVFEILSRLTPRLPNFSLGNWQSTIRDRVKCLPEYADIQAWDKRETSDIIYDDQDGVLTHFLTDKGYLMPESLWSTRRPHYFIEVKSTTGPCETPFYMSKNQFQMIQDKSNGPSGLEHPEVVYVVFRVFNVGRDSMDLAIYVDPNVWRLKEDLVFKAETWSIVPKNRNSR